MKHLLVLNPLSRIGKDEKLLNELLNHFSSLDYELYVTTSPKSATEYLREYFKTHKDHTRVYAIGGDGTLNEVVNGLVGYDNVDLAAIPSGTGNDFIKIYGGLSSFEDINKLINGDISPIDVTSIKASEMKEPLYSINVINFGFDAIVGARGNYYKEHGYPQKAIDKGLSPYDYALKNDALKHGRCNTIEVYADNEKLNEKNLMLATLAQGQYVGGQFHCAPKSNNQDGLIDVCVLKPMSLIGLGLFIGKYTKGMHLNKKHSKVIYRQAKEVRFIAPNEIDVCVDGEMIKGKEFEVKIVPNAIKWVMPK